MRFFPCYLYVSCATNTATVVAAPLKMRAMHFSRGRELEEKEWEHSKLPGASF